MPEIDYGTVVETKKTLLTTYDVTDKHLCINERGNPLPDIVERLRDDLDKRLPDWSEGSDYFNLYPFKEKEVWPVDSRIAVFYVKGGSEGYYVHVEAQHDGRSDLEFLGKTLREGEEGISWAEQMVCALSRILEV